MANVAVLGMIMGALEEQAVSNPALYDQDHYRWCALGYSWRNPTIAKLYKDAEAKDVSVLDFFDFDADIYVYLFGGNAKNEQRTIFDAIKRFKKVIKDNPTRKQYDGEST